MWSGWKRVQLFSFLFFFFLNQHLKYLACVCIQPYLLSLYILLPLENHLINKQIPFLNSLISVYTALLGISEQTAPNLKDNYHSEIIKLFLNLFNPSLKMEKGWHEPCQATLIKAERTLMKIQPKCPFYFWRKVMFCCLFKLYQRHRKNVLETTENRTIFFFFHETWYV